MVTLRMRVRLEDIMMIVRLRVIVKKVMLLVWIMRVMDELGN